MQERTPMETLQKLTLLLADQIEDQSDINDEMIKALSEVVELLTKMEAANGLLEARVQFLEANND